MNDSQTSDNPSTVFEEPDYASVKEDANHVSASAQTSESDIEAFKAGSDSENADDFDWEDEDPEEDSRYDDKVKRDRPCFFCLDRRSSLKSWITHVILALISVGVCVGVSIAVHPGDEDATMKSYNLSLWFTFIAFMFCISFVMQCLVEILPWVFKKTVDKFYPTRSEYLRSRLSVVYFILIY